MHNDKPYSVVYIQVIQATQVLRTICTKQVYLVVKHNILHAFIV